MMLTNMRVTMSMGSHFGLRVKIRSHRICRIVGFLFCRHQHFTQVPRINRRLMLNKYTTGGYMKYGSLPTVLSLWGFSNASGWIIIDDALQMTTLVDSLL